MDSKPEKPNRAQMCIDHIIKKKALVDKDKTRDTNSVSNMLSHLIVELKQYVTD